MVISLKLNSNYYNAVSFLVEHLPNRDGSSEYDLKNQNNEVSNIASPEYLWIPHSIFNKSFHTHSFTSNKGVKADRLIMMMDDRFLSILDDTSSPCIEKTILASLILKQFINFIICSSNISDSLL